MAKVILLCGKICCGKSTYAQVLKKKLNAVVLSCDELMLSLFDEHLGERHSEILRKSKVYLYNLTEQIISTNTNVILDFGFWSKSERSNVKVYFNKKGIETELHYIKVSDTAWLRNIEKRNLNIKSGDLKNYYIDDNMKHLFSKRFEEPDKDEIDVLFENHIN